MPFETFLATLHLAVSLAVHPAAVQTPAGQAPDRVVLPDVTVTAQKEPAKAQELPLSLTVRTSGTLERAGVTIVSDAAVGAPNLVFTEFTARKLSNARFRGVGSSPANPAVTALFDGVPQLHANASSVELLDVEQIEFVRGPQSALFGRNTLGGLVNVTSTRPSLSQWTGQVVAPVGNYGARDFRGSVSGPITAALAVALAYGHDERDGFTTNQVTGRAVDDRSADFGKAQLLWVPSAQWETRLIVSGERSRDGDYALNDLGSLRSNPFIVARDFGGRQDRDVASATVVARREGARVSVTSTSGFVRWKTQDVTDLDYSPLSYITRDNTEEAKQFTQEIRLASAASAPVRLSDAATLTWQAGVFGFTQRYEQDAINTYSPFVLSEFLAFPVMEHTPKGTIKDSGLAAFGHTTLTFNDRVDLTLGARADRERKTADLRSFFDPMIAPDNLVNAERSWTNVSPSVALAYRLGAGHMLYASTSRGFKAGGFNPAAPPSATIYDEEQTWNAEAGVKTTWADGRVQSNVALFSIDWTDLQLNLPIPTAPGQFYIANVGGATSRGIELELTARAASGVDVFGAFGYTRARFSDGSVSSGADVSDNLVPFTPDYTVSLGLDVSRTVRQNLRAFGRAEIVRHGSFQYDDANSAGQEAYALVNARAGIGVRRISVEAWIKNAFDTRYIPTAFAFPGLAPSGFVGEMGRPRTFGISLRVGF
jgi:iron complex outermembrane receptor protein